MAVHVLCFSSVAGDSQEGDVSEAAPPLGNPDGEESKAEISAKNETENSEIPLLDITDIIYSLNHD